MSRLREQYKNEIIPKLKEELGMSNALSVPKIEKITINMGLGSALGDKKVLESALEELSLISSQKPVTCLARKSVARTKKMGVNFDFEINLTSLIYDGSQVIGVQGDRKSTRLNSSHT